MKLKKGDKVMVIAGKAKGETGTIARVLRRKDLVVLDGVNLMKRHRKPTAQNRKGQIIDISVPLHVSNVMLVDPHSGKPTRIKLSRENGRRARIAVRSGESIK